MLLGVNQHSEAEAEKATQKVLGVDVLAHEPWLKAEMDALSHANAALITSIPEQYLLQVRNVVMQALRVGGSTDDLTAAVQRIGQVTESRAKLIARDQVGKALGQITKLRQQSLGVEEFEWVTAGDERVRDSHSALNGKHFRWDDPPTDAQTGEKVHPGEAIQCRCTAIAVFPSLADVQERISQEYVPSAPTILEKPEPPARRSRERQLPLPYDDEPVSVGTIRL